ncbi:cysteine-rich venom protein-like [Sceloporus undulatus]|uniref:cysteine-rich venom protein-like n=1 Tax=Sceloporus undulatus TaxID=8520 RepID=UPI001C4B2EDA|nr:cysteine-rich venom protein-like [Sceloporus undulatus]
MESQPEYVNKLLIAEKEGSMKVVASEEMSFLINLLPFAVVFQHFLGQVNPVTVGNISAKKQKEIVDRHNAVRTGVKPTASNMLKMTWDPKASETAKKWAGKCKGQTSPKEERVVDGIYCGENILITTKPTSWSAIITDWSAKAVNFQYGRGPINDINLSDVYTQLVWYNSHRVGCAVAHCPKEMVPFIYVCHYCPVGNIIQSLTKPYKAGEPCADCPNHCENNLCTNPCSYVDHIVGCDKLLKMSNCNEDFFGKNCQATCKCKTEIK